jgi:hypothetical protein
VAWTSDTRSQQDQQGGSNLGPPFLFVTACAVANSEVGSHNSRLGMAGEGLIRAIDPRFPSVDGKRSHPREKEGDLLLTNPAEA